MNLRDELVEFREVPTHLIDEPRLAARLEMDEDKMTELVADVTAKGVLVPIHVFRTGERYEVVAGHRRRIAAGRAGLPAIRCLIYANGSAALEAVKFSENRHREEMSAAEEASFFSELLVRDCHNDTNELAALLGEKRSYVEGRLLLFQGAPEVFNALARRQISIGIAQELNKCGDKLMRDYFLSNAIRDGATVALVTRWIQQWRASLGPGGEHGSPLVQAAALGPIPQTNYFTCVACDGTEDVHLMQPVNVHSHCRKAILEKALAMYARRGAVLEFPRTIAEAAALVNQILERFPELGAQ